MRLSSEAKRETCTAANVLARSTAQADRAKVAVELAKGEELRAPEEDERDDEYKTKSS